MAAVLDFVAGRVVFVFGFGFGETLSLLVPRDAAEGLGLAAAFDMAGFLADRDFVFGLGGDFTPFARAVLAAALVLGRA